VRLAAKWRPEAAIGAFITFNIRSKWCKNGHASSFSSFSVFTKILTTVTNSGPQRSLYVCASAASVDAMPLLFC